MARTLSVEEEIQRPTAEVWERLTDWSNAYPVDARGRRDRGRRGDRRRDKTDIPCARGGPVEHHRPLRSG